MKAVSGIFVGALVLILALELKLLHQEWSTASKLVSARNEMSKLKLLALETFPDGRGIRDSEFWAKLGRPGNPILDPWGKAYRVDYYRVNEFVPAIPLWRCAGPDGIYGTKDDLIVPISIGSEKLDGSMDPTAPSLKFADPAK